jgi:hypothetical protein
MKKLYKFLLISVLSSITLFYSCDTVELELLTSPNELSVDQADPDLLLNSIQLSYRVSQRIFQANSADLGRIDAMFGRNYLENFGPGTLTTSWNSYYSNNAPNLQAIIGLNENPDKDLSYHIAMAKTLQAHTLMQLVDFLGDVPFSEAGNPVEFPKPTVDDDESVYNEAIAMLAEAKVLFQGTSGIGTGTDLFYDGDESKWIKLVNTLEMRANLTTKNYAAVVSATNVIESTDDDFQFNYGDNVLSPDTRHPNYADDYTNSGANIYQNNWLVSQMIGAFPHGDLSASTDPRRRYYFYRQSFNTPGNFSLFEDVEGRFGPAGTIYGYNGDGSGETISCSLQDTPSHLQFTPDEEIWCSTPLGYWGRFHGNDEGTPPDNFTRTAVGVYPSGGSFDGYPDAAPFIAHYEQLDGSITTDPSGEYIGYVASINFLYNQAVGLGDGGAGAGIDPIYLASYVDFMKAEANLALGNTAAAATHLEAGMTKSIAKVQSFGALDASADFSQAPGSDKFPNTVPDFIAAKVAEFNDADATTSLDASGFPSAKDKFDILGEQYFIAIYGGAGDAFNFIRRTGYPRTLSRSIDGNADTFPRTVLYPGSEVSANSNLQQKADLSTTVFWDAGIINPAN